MLNYRTLSQSTCNYFHILWRYLSIFDDLWYLQFWPVLPLAISCQTLYALRGCNFILRKILFYRTNCQKSNIFLMKIHIWIIVFIGDYEYCPGGPKFMLPRSNTKWNIEPPTFWEKHSTFISSQSISQSCCPIYDNAKEDHQWCGVAVEIFDPLGWHYL